MLQDYQMIYVHFLFQLNVFGLILAVVPVIRNPCANNVSMTAYPEIVVSRKNQVSDHFYIPILLQLTIRYVKELMMIHKPT